MKHHLEQRITLAFLQFINLSRMETLFFNQNPHSEYMDDLNNSQGFYVTPGKDGSVLLGCIKRVEEYSGDHYRTAELAAKFAVEEHNKQEGKRGSLNFLGIVNLNLEPAAGAIYYITMAAADGSGDASHYQVKVWVKLNSGYRVLIFKPAPYCRVKSSVKIAKEVWCVGITNLLPWMDESYLYYKCFYGVREALLGVEIIQNEQSGSPKGVLWFGTYAESEKVLKKYVVKKMPCTNKFYVFYLGTYPRNSIL